MFNEDFFNAVREHNYFDGNISVDWNLYDFIKFLHSHPNSSINWYDVDELVVIHHIEFRNKAPQFVKDIIKKLQITFPQNRITCHAFVGFTEDSSSFGIHKDSMDVLYLQVIGEVTWSMWECETEKNNIQPEEGLCVYKETFKPGDWIWVPRGHFHCSEPKSLRVGLSFGIEGEINPSTYI